MNVTCAVGVGLLHAAQVVLVGDASEYIEYSPSLVAVPEVDGGAGERRAAVGDVEQRQRRWSAARPRPCRDAEPKLERDVAAHDAALGRARSAPLEPSPG